MKNVVAIIQARMGSTRLPGKVLLDIEGKPMLWHVVNRLKKSRLIDKIVIATTVSERDLLILRFAEENGIDRFAGSEEDVLDRYYRAAKKFRADLIVRITADCPLIDPAVVDRVIQYYLDNKDNLDHVGTAGSFPDGLDVSLTSFAALEKAWLEAKLPSEREHVGPYIWKNPQIFRLAKIESDEDYSHLRWTVDDEKDLLLVREIYRNLYRGGRVFLMPDILDFLNKNPHLSDINKDTIRNEGYLISLKRDEQYIKLGKRGYYGDTGKKINQVC